MMVRSRVDERVIEALQDNEPLSVGEIAAHITESIDDTKVILRKMTRNGDLGTTSDWKFKLASKHRGNNE